MQRYIFKSPKIDWETNTTIIIISTQYKCLICGYTHDWDDSWTVEVKEEVKKEVDQHHNDHIIDQTIISE